MSEIDAALLGILRAELEAPGLEYSSPPQPISGGFDTTIYGFELGAAPAPFDGPLVVRIFTDAAGARRAVFEGAIQGAIAAQGYPCPPALLVHEEAEPLGGACIVMPRVPGRPMLDALMSRSFFAMPGTLARAHAELHALNAEQVMKELEKRNVPLPPIGTAAWLAELRGAFEAGDYPGMRSGLEWLEANAPAAQGGPAVCHLDFHPLNVLVQQGQVTGVIDWAGCRFGDPAADVGIARVILTMGPLKERGLLRAGLDVARKWFARKYLQEYRELREVPLEDVRYFEAMRCFAAMLNLSQRRSRALNPGGYAWSGPREVANLTRHFRAISGVTIVPVTD